jgi:hypothetical protein
MDAKSEWAQQQLTQTHFVAFQVRRKGKVLHIVGIARIVAAFLSWLVKGCYWNTESSLLGDLDYAFASAELALFLERRKSVLIWVELATCKMVTRRMS